MNDEMIGQANKDKKPLVSAVIPTYHREDLLPHAVRSVLAQESEQVDVEVVVVNDAGDPLAPADWQRDPRVQIVTTHRTERSIARNTGAALASGEYLHFLDDDDIALPGAYDALLELTRDDDDVVLACGAFEEIREGEDDLRRVSQVVDSRLFALLVAGVGIPLGTCLVRRLAFWRAGAFDVSFTVMEDLELLQRLVLQGKSVATDHLTGRFRMGMHAVSTTDWRASDDVCRRQREKVFDMRLCYSRLRESLQHPISAGLRGRLARYYMGSAFRHTRDLSPAKALGRLAAGMGIALPGLVRPTFWTSMLSKENRPEL